MPKLSKQERKKGNNIKNAKNLSNRQAKLQKIQYEKSTEKVYMFNSIIKTFILMILFFVISLLYNGRILTLGNLEDPEAAKSTLETITHIGVKAGSVILFFFFGMITIGNYQELKGYTMGWKGILLLFVLSILLASTEGDIFFVSLLGIVLVMGYLYMVQGKVQDYTA